jgi:hypothetical protein
MVLYISKKKIIAAARRVTGPERAGSGAFADFPSGLRSIIITPPSLSFSLLKVNPDRQYFVINKI